MKKRVRITVGPDEWALLESKGIYNNLGMETYEVMMVNGIPQLKVGYTVVDDHIPFRERWMAWRVPPLHHPLTVPDYRFPSNVVVESVPAVTGLWVDGKQVNTGGEEE